MKPVLLLTVGTIKDILQLLFSLFSSLFFLSSFFGVVCFLFLVLRFFLLPLTGVDEFGELLRFVELAAILCLSCCLRYSLILRRKEERGREEERKRGREEEERKREGK